MRIDKLVRDRIVEIIEQVGKKVEFHVADREEYWKKLKEKLIEEVEEFVESEDMGELADVLEVIDAILKFKRMSWEELERIRVEKRAERGGFEKRMVLDRVLDR